MKTNVAKKSEPIYTHGGSKAVKITPLKELKRSVMSCMLWENEFYESGVTIANRIAELVPKVKPADVAALAVYARSKGKLRHVPLWLVRHMANSELHKGLVTKTLAEVIQRPDELTEMLSLYWKAKKQPISAQVKKGLAKAFLKFNSYSLAKYNQDSAITLKDVMALCHPVPQNEEQSKMFRQLVGNYCVCGHTHYNKDKRIREDKCKECNCSKFVLDKLPTPDTWETILSDTTSKLSKKEKWEKAIDTWIIE